MKDLETLEYWDNMMARASAVRRERLLPREMPQSDSVRVLPREMPQSDGVRDEEEPGSPQQESTERTRLKPYRIDEKKPEQSFKRRAVKGVKKVFRKISNIFRSTTPTEEKPTAEKPAEEPQRGRSRTRKRTRMLLIPISGQLPPVGMF